MANLALFEEKLNNNITLSLSAKELAERIVIAALEAEYGKAFTMSRGFAKMVNTLAEALVTNPDLRRQALSVASLSIRKNRDYQKNIRKGS
jgi:hypothetical protein